MKSDLMRNSKGESMRGCCVQTIVRSLSSNGVLRPLVPILFLVLMVMYGLADKLQSFVAGIFIPQYHYPYAVALCFGQVLISLLLLNLLHILDLVPLQRYSASLGERLLVPSICDSVRSVLEMWAQASSASSGLLPLALPLLPPLTAALSLALKLTSTPSIHVSALLSILSGTSTVGRVSNGVLLVEPLEYLYAPLSLLLHALALTSLAKVSEVERQHSPHVSVFDIYHVHLVNQGWLLGLLWLLHPDRPWKVLSQGSWQTLLFLGYLLAILLLGMLRNFLLGMSALCVSPLVASLLHSARQMMEPFL